MQDTFKDWLKQNSKQVDAALLLTFADGAADPAKIVYPSDFALSIAETDPQNKADLLQALRRAERDYEEARTPPKAGWAIAFGKIVILAFGLIVAGLLFVGILSDTFLKNLADPATARGLITFLFSVSAIAIFLLTSASIFWANRSDAQFTQAKDILSILVGILGTILGFYFASVTEDNATAQFAVASLAVSPEIWTAGDSAALTARLTGGRAPYVYSIRFTSPDNRVSREDLTRMERLGRVSDSGGVDETAIAVPQVSGGAVLVAGLTAEDADGRQVRQTNTISILPASTP